MDGNDVAALSATFLDGDGLAVPGGEAGHDHGGEPGESTSVRTFEHKGHDVCIETTYRITIDGRVLQGHVEVLPSGAVHYHRFPQYAPRSAVDVVKTVIDTIWERPEVPDELAGDEPAPDGHDHDGHDHRGHR
jgi:hypothetical protein